MKQNKELFEFEFGWLFAAASAALKNSKTSGFVEVVIVEVVIVVVVTDVVVRVVLVVVAVLVHVAVVLVTKWRSLSASCRAS